MEKDREYLFGGLEEPPMFDDTEPKITTNQLMPGMSFMVRGLVQRSRIRTRVEGDELIRANRRSKLEGGFEQASPYTVMQVKNARVLFTDPEAVNDPSKRKLQEKYAVQRLYISPKHPGDGYCFTCYNKGKVLPWVGKIISETKFERINDIPHELATDLDVTMVMKVYKSRFGNGISLEGVLLNEPIKYKKPIDLAEYGLVFMPVKDSKAEHKTDNTET